MKKALLSLAVLAACTGVARAQDTDTHFGIKAGASLSNFVGKDVSSTSSYLFGFHAGFVANVAFSERFSLQPELLYSTKGAKDKLDVLGTSITATQSLHYIELPILVKAKFSQFFVEAGPQFGGLLRGKAKVEGGSASEDETNTKQFSFLDFGYAVGLGYQLESGPMIGARYNGGLSNVAESVSVNGLATQVKARNNAFQLYVGYMFGGK